MSYKKKIVLYCAGKFAISCFPSLQQMYEIICWVDRNYKSIGELYEKEICSPDILYEYNDEDYDLVYICTGNINNENEIRNKLQTKYNINSNKITSTIEFGIKKNRSKYRNILNTVLCNYKYKLTEKRIKIRFFISTRVYLWNAVNSLVQAFLLDEDIDVLVVPNDLYNHKLLCILQNEKIPYEDGQIFDIYEDNPNISILIDVLHDRDKIKEIANNSKYCLWLCYNLQNPYQSFDAFSIFILDYLKQGIDKCILDKSIYYNIINKISEKSEAIVCLGSPKFDSIYESINEKNYYPPKWEKIKNKRKILWATEHGVLTGYINTSIKEYFTTIFNYFQNNKDLALIFRPHPMLNSELVEGNIWSNEEWNLFIKAINGSDNIVYDDFTDYGYSYRFCDGILTSVTTGIGFSALVLDKPIGLIYFNEDYNNNSIGFPDMIENLYPIKNEQELMSFFNELKLGIDSTKYTRNKLFIKYIEQFDGKNGEKMMQYILSDYYKNYD